MSDDWTWVLERQCDECGFDAQALRRDELAARMRVNGGAWRQLLGRGPVLESLRDGDDRSWTPLEYGCHVRDVYELMEERIRKMLKKRKPPTFKNWDQDEAAAKGEYAMADAGKVAYALARNAGKLADVIDRVDGDEWEKEGERSDGKRFTVESLARYTLHDVEHHLWDVHEMLDG